MTYKNIVENLIRCIWQILNLMFEWSPYKTVWQTLINSCYQKFFNLRKKLLKQCCLENGVRKIFLEVEQQRPIFETCHSSHPNPILQAWTIVAQSFKSNVARFLDPWLMKHSVKNLTLCWRTNYFTCIFARVLKTCKKPLRYLVYNRCLCEFNYNLAENSKITCKIIFFASCNLQVC